MRGAGGARARIAVAIVAIGLGALGVREWIGAPDSGDAATGPTIPLSGPITIAATGDALVARALEDEDAFGPVRDIVAAATLATTNLDLVLLGPDEAREAAALPQPRWPFGSARDAETLREAGFDFVSLANNHAFDYDVIGLASTRRILTAGGLLHAGTGLDLTEARTPALVGPEGRRVAFLSVTTSFSPLTRATAAEPDLEGRPGVYALRYDADVTVDRATFETLRRSVEALGAGPSPGGEELSLFGTRIRRGADVQVRFLVNDADQAAILDDVAAARRDGNLVVLSIHSHEPSNLSEEPAPLLRDFARAAIDRGASLVVGHGPHRLRGIEWHGDGVILYSLGNLIYQEAAVDFRAADMFDVATDLHAVAIGALTAPAADPSVLDAPEWWESVVAVATAEESGRIREVRLFPIDLGADRSAGERGEPSLAGPTRAAVVLARLVRLSAPYGTRIAVQDGVGLVSR